MMELVLVLSVVLAILFIYHMMAQNASSSLLLSVPRFWDVARVYSWCVRISTKDKIYFKAANPTRLLPISKDVYTVRKNVSPTTQNDTLSEPATAPTQMPSCPGARPTLNSAGGTLKALPLKMRLSVVADAHGNV